MCVCVCVRARARVLDVVARNMVFASRDRVGSWCMWGCGVSAYTAQQQQQQQQQQQNVYGWTT